MIAPSQLALFDLGQSTEGLLMLNHRECEPWPGLNPRTYFDPLKSAEMDVSVRELGVLQNIVVHDRGANGEPYEGLRYWIVSGESRWRSAGRVGVRLLARARWFTEQQALHVALLENLQRNSLRAREEGRGFKHALELDPDLTQEELGKRYSLDQSYVSNRIRLLDLPDSIGELIDRGLIGPTIARDHLFGLLKLEAAQSAAICSAIANMINGRAEASEPVTSVYLAPVVTQLTQIFAPSSQPLTKIEDAPKPGSTGAARAKQKAVKKATPKKPAPRRQPGTKLSDKDRAEIRKLAKSGSCTVEMAMEMWSLTEPELLAIARTGWADPIDTPAELVAAADPDVPSDERETPEEPDNNSNAVEVTEFLNQHARVDDVVHDATFTIPDSERGPFGEFVTKCGVRGEGFMIHGPATCTECALIKTAGASPVVVGVGQADGTARAADDGGETAGEIQQEGIVEVPAVESVEHVVDATADVDVADVRVAGALAQLAPILGDYTINMMLYQPVIDGPVVLTASPKRTDGKGSSITPIVMKGTLAELDARLPEALREMVSTLTDEDA